MAQAESGPVPLTQEILQDGKVAEMGRWAFSIVTPASCVGRTMPPLGVAFPAWPLRRNTLVVFGDDNEGGTNPFPNAWNAVKPKPTKLDTLARDFVMVSEGALRVGAQLEVTMGTVKVLHVTGHSQSFACDNGRRGAVGGKGETEWGRYAR